MHATHPWDLFLTSASLLLVGADFLAAVEGTARHPRAGEALFFAADMLMGIWTAWVYSAIGPALLAAITGAQVYERVNSVSDAPRVADQS